MARLINTKLKINFEEGENFTYSDLNNKASLEYIYNLAELFNSLQDEKSDQIFKIITADLKR